MEPATIAALVGGGASFLGAITGNQVSRANAQDANNMSQSNAREQMAFQERMSNSAYQRAMVDMKTAGLNPMLAYSQGGASAPSGASGSVTTPDYQDPLGPAVNTAMDTYSKTKTLKNMDDQQSINKANSTSQILLQTAQAKATAQSARNAAIQQQLLESQLGKAKAEQKFYESPQGKLLYNIDKFSDSIGGVLDNIFSAKRIFKRDSKRMEQKLNKSTGEIELYGY